MECDYHAKMALLSVAATIIGALIYNELLFGDKHLKCSEASAHSKANRTARRRAGDIFALANGTLVPDVPRRWSRRHPPTICCMTTVASRIRRLQPVLLSMATQQPPPAAVVVAPDRSVPWRLVREAAGRWTALASASAPVRVVRMPDGLGPLDKAWGCLRYAEAASLPSNTVLVVSDDDYRRGSGWLASLASRSLLHAPEDRRLVSFELPQYAASLRVRGSNGYAAHLSSFGSAEAMFAFAVRVEEACRCMDDVSVVGYMRGPRGCSVLSRSIASRAACTCARAACTCAGS